ncbi:MAG: hypothetical protein Q8903_05470, partial [Bacteroidota bacterium]|nr:hypothetical protein [Bacteroidota bacterium]
MQNEFLIFFGMGLAIGARTKTEFWACQNGMNVILSTTDAGENWISNTIPDNKTLSDIIFVDSCKGFAAGRGGVIFKYDSSYPVSVGREIKNEKFILHQNYPNPFNPSTTISFNLEHSQNVKLFIYNML